MHLSGLRVSVNSESYFRCIFFEVNKDVEFNMDVKFNMNINKVIFTCFVEESDTDVLKNTTLLPLVTNFIKTSRF